MRPNRLRPIGCGQSVDRYEGSSVIPPYYSDGKGMQLLPTRRDPPGGPPRLRIVDEREVAPARAERGPRLQAGLRDWFDDVVKWLYALGAPGADTEDLAQEIFLVVRRQLARFDGGNLAGLAVSDRAAHRARPPAPRLVQEPGAAARSEIDLTQMPHAAAGPARSYEEAENRRLLQDAGRAMSEKRRSDVRPVRDRRLLRRGDRPHSGHPARRPCGRGCTTHARTSASW